MYFKSTVSISFKADIKTLNLEFKEILSETEINPS